uniref:Uncharacterized protein n=1 Tax=Esox lucius TaxID=8010 RepID=A0A3P8YX94_ESOLU
VGLAQWNSNWVELPHHPLKFHWILYSSVTMTCNWFPASQVPEDLQLYYRYSGKDDIAECGDYLNTFLVHPTKPKAPKVNIKKEGNDLILRWDPPNLETLVRSKQSTENIPYARCQYRVQVKAVYSNGCGLGGSDWSEVYIYCNEDWLITVMSVIIPASLFLFVILFLCCTEKKTQPSLIFKAILNSSSKEQKVRPTTSSEVFHNPV